MAFGDPVGYQIGAGGLASFLAGRQAAEQSALNRFNMERANRQDAISEALARIQGQQAAFDFVQSKTNAPFVTRSAKAQSELLKIQADTERQIQELLGGALANVNALTRKTEAETQAEIANAQSQIQAQQVFGNLDASAPARQPDQLQAAMEGLDYEELLRQYKMRKIMEALRASPSRGAGLAQPDIYGPQSPTPDWITGEDVRGYEALNALLGQSGI